MKIVAYAFLVLFGLACGTTHSGSNVLANSNNTNPANYEPSKESVLLSIKEENSCVDHSYYNYSELSTYLEKSPLLVKGEIKKAKKKKKKESVNFAKMLSLPITGADNNSYQFPDFINDLAYGADNPNQRTIFSELKKKRNIFVPLGNFFFLKKKF